MASKIEINNRKASHLYFLIETFTAGMQLQGTEIKSIRKGQASLSDAYCAFHGEELYAYFHVTEYSHGGYMNHHPKRERKLLLSKKELDKLKRKAEVKGFTIVPTKLFISDKGWAKLDIALAKGKANFDKRDTLKEKDSKRDMDRAMKF